VLSSTASCCFNGYVRLLDIMVELKPGVGESGGRFMQPSLAGSAHVIGWGKVCVIGEAVAISR
jgi:hypothetical protein